MKKFWIVLLALGLVAGFAMSASAADVKFSGSYYVIGSYADNPSNLKEGTAGRVNPAAIYNQRLRLQTEFKIAEGLMLVTRIDALEKDWGDYTWRATGTGRVETASRPALAPAGVNLQESIEFERAYVDFNTKIGKFMVGYQNFIVPVGPLTVIAAIEKRVENSIDLARTDYDQNVYDLGVVYKFGAGDAGLMFQYVDNRTARSTTGLSAQAQFYALNPYAKMKFGPVFVEAEGIYAWGKLAKFDDLAAAQLLVPTATDIDLSTWGFYLHAKADIGPAYVGGIFSYARGDDITTAGTREGGMARALTLGQAWDPCLILWNDGTSRSITGALGAAIAATPGYDVFFDNAWMGQLYGGFKPTKDLDIFASLTYAVMDQNLVANQISKDIGWEFDLTAKYKIFDNLEYMAGFGYLFVGDAWKGAVAATPLANNYLLIHKLTLSF
jgi:hypothetical protein